MFRLTHDHSIADRRNLYKRSSAAVEWKDPNPEHHPVTPRVAASRN